MPSFANTAIWLYRRIFGSRPLFQPEEEGIDLALDGNSAVAVVEASICEAATLGATFPADAATTAWRSEQHQLGVNIFGNPLVGQGAEGPRGALAAAIGLSLSGTRTTAFFSGPDMAAVQDLLVIAAGQHLPLVLHMSNRALASHAGALGSGHEACHMSADSGFFLLFAANVQEAADFTLIARKAAELSLIPGMVIMDGEQTALANQNVRLTSPELIRNYLGSPSAHIPAATPSQKLLFGETRRWVPRWYDLDRPVLQGGVQGTESFALGLAAKRPYFDHHFEQILDESLTLFTRHAGRQHALVTDYQLSNAQLVLVALGAAIETMEAVADHLRKTNKMKVGVLGLRCLRPFPGKLIVAKLRKKRVVAVSERLDVPLAEDPPLMREIRASLDRAFENSRYGVNAHAGYPVLSQNERPRLCSVVYGLGGHPLQGADLVALCPELLKGQRSPIYLGVDFAPSTGVYPKRQVSLDMLRRSYPEIVELGLQGKDPAPDLRPQGAFSVAVHRISGQGGDALATEASTMLAQITSGQIRSRNGLFWGRWESSCVDSFTHASKELRDPGDDIPIDIAVVATRLHPKMKPNRCLQPKGAILLSSPLSDEELLKSMSSELQSAIVLRGIDLYCIASSDDAVSADTLMRSKTTSTSTNDGIAGDELDLDSVQGHVSDLDETGEWLLGSLFKVMLDKDLLKVNPRRIYTARETNLKHLANTSRTRRLQAFQHGFESIRKISVTDIAPAQENVADTWNDEAPLVVQKLAQDDTSYDSLPRFWDHIGVLYRNNEPETLTADPYMATGTVPSLSSTFRDMENCRENIPVFHPDRCTGCGDCWTYCPDSAIGAIAIRPNALLDAGIRLAKVDALRQVAANLTKRVQSVIHQSESPPHTLGELLTQAYEPLAQKMPLPEERKKALQTGIEGLIDQLGSLPVAVTKSFYEAPEDQDKGSGELLTVAINPEACKGCGLCITSCNAQALTAVTQNRPLIERVRNTWKLWEQLPETSATTIARASQDPEIGAMAALLLARRQLRAVAGGDGAEAGSGEKVAVRLILAAMEKQQQPIFERFGKEIEETQHQITRLIKETLVNALPTEDLDALANGLDSAHSREVDLSSLTQYADTAIEGSHIDSSRLRRLVELAQALADLRWRLSEGPHGLGRAATGLIVAHGAVSSWAGTFPYNPFRAPTVVDMTGDAAQLAAGLLQGQLAEATEGATLLRKAKLEIEQPVGAERERATLERLHWDSLEEHERRLCPPLLVIGNDDVLGGKGYSQVAWLLSSGLPVKILVLADLDLGIDVKVPVGASISALKHPRINLALAALANRQAYVAQSSIAAPAHLLTSIEAAFEYAGPALIHVHAPSPERHGFAPHHTIRQAHLAIQTRAFPLFRYDPEGEGVFGSRITLDGNPHPEAQWSLDEDGVTQTPINWALGEKRFSMLFSPLTEDTPSPTTIDAYLGLDVLARQGKTPYVAVKRATEEDGELRYRIDALLVSAVEERLHTWRTLQELAGIETPFTTHIEKQAQERVAQLHEAELVAIKASYEQRIQNLRDEMQGEIAQQIRGRLMSLAGFERH